MARRRRAGRNGVRSTRSRKQIERRPLVSWRTLRCEPLEDRRLLNGAADEPAIQLFQTSPALFVENRGQWSDPSIRYLHQGDGASVAMTDAGPVFEVFRQEAVTGAADGLPNDPNSLGPLGHLDPEATTTEALTFSASFLGARTVTPIGLQPSETQFNYFIGDQSNWRSEVPGYELVAYEGLYEGINLRTWGQRDSLKYEFHVAPGADYQQIQVHYSGIEGLALKEDGSLQVDLGGDWGELVDDAPYIYQVIDGRQVEVAGRFELIDDCTYSFTVTGDYDASRELVIDPDLAWATYLGGSSEEYGYGISVDASGNALVTGYTYSFAGASGSNHGSTDAFVAMVSPSGTLSWATYLGGSGYDVGRSISADASGSALVTGYTYSTNFAGATGSYHGSFDAFVAKVSPSGTLAWATYLGGSGYDDGWGISVDASGNALVTGDTSSTNFAGATGSNHGDNYDAFVAKVSPSGTLSWATYLGGSGYDCGDGISVDALGSALVTGYTSSTNFAGASGSYHGSDDAFVAKVSPSGAFAWVTYLGGSSDDIGRGISVDGSGNALVTGDTSSTNFAGATGSNHGSTDTFVAKVSPSGAFAWATYLGGSGGDSGRGISVDGSGNALVTGDTSSTNFAGASGSYHGSIDTFVAKISGAGSLPPGEVHGSLWNDLDGDGQHDAGEPAIAGWQVSLGAMGTVTGTDGSYAFLDLPPGTYTISEVLPAGWVQTSPAGAGTRTVQVASGQVVVGMDFGNWIPDVGDTIALAAGLGVLAVDTPVTRSQIIGNGLSLTRDVDFYGFMLLSPATVRLDLDAAQTGSGLDSYLRLLDAQGRQIAANDDAAAPGEPATRDSYLSIDLAAGTYYVGVSGLSNRSYNPLIAGSGVAGSTGPFSLEVTLTPTAPLTPLDPTDLELLARQVAYRDWTTQVSVGIRNYRVDRVFDSPDGFDAFGLVSTTGDPPVLAIRGTQLSLSGLTDMLDDLNPQGIGYQQFLDNRQAVESWLGSVGQRPYIVGHSLGGALAQWFAADYTSQSSNALLGQVVTFNSPGISRAYVENFQVSETAGVTHYITSGDIVSMAGEAFLPGTYNLFTYDETTLNPLTYLVNKHCLPVVVSSYLDKSGNPVNRPSGQSVPSTNTDWLSSPLFCYTDAEHLVFVAAMTAAAAPFPTLRTLPPAILFRGTTEGVRREFGGAFEQLRGGMNLGISSEGLWVILPDMTLALPGDLSLKVEDLSALYVASPMSLKVQGRGKLALKPLGDITADFAGDNYICFTGQGIEVVGEVGVSGPIFLGPGFSLEDLSLQIDTVSDHWYGEGTLNVPAGFGITVGVGFLGGVINDFTLGLVDLNKPILFGPPPALVPIVYLQDITARLEDFAPGPPSVKLGGGMGLTAGPRIDDLYLLRLDLDTEYDTAGRLTGTGEVLLGGGDDPFHFASASVVVDKSYGVYLGGTMTFGGGSTGSFSLSGSARLGLDQVFQGSLKGTVQAPTWAGGWQLASATAFAQYLADGNATNDYVIVGGQVLGLRHAVSVNLNTGKIDWWADYSKLQSVTVTPPSGTSEVTAMAMSEPQEFILPAGLDRALFRIEWENGDTDIQLTDPLGTIYTPENVGSYPGVAYYRDTESRQAVFELTNPAAGAWQVVVTETEGIGTYTIESRQLSTAPVITLLEPQQDAAGRSVSITWVDEDSDSDALIGLYCDTDRSGADGQPIVAGISQDAGPDQYTWDTTGVPTGDYYVYAVIDDGTNVPAVSYSTGRVHVVDPAAPGQVTALNAPEGVSTTARLTWTAPVGATVDHYLVRLTADAAGDGYQQVVAAADTQAVLTGLTPGETYRVALAAVDAAGRVGTDSEPIVLVAGAVATVPPEAGQWEVFATAGSRYQSQVPGDVGDTYTLVSSPSGTGLDASVFTWDVPAEATGWQSVVVRVTTPTGETQVYRYRLFVDQTGPVLAAGPILAEASGTASTALVAPDGQDAAGVLRYQWQRNGEILPNWYTTPAWSDTGLSPNTAYTYQVRVKDAAPAGQTSAWSAPVTVHTWAAVPTTVVVGTASETTVPLTALGTDGNPAGTEYAIYNASVAAYLDTSGYASPGPVWQPATAWAGVTIQGLQSDREYALGAMARNTDLVETAAGPLTTIRTAPETVSPTVVSASYVLGEVRLQFSEPVELGMKDITVNDSTEQAVDLSGAVLEHVPGTDQATLRLNWTLASGNYTLILSGSSLQDLAGNLLDGNADSMAGDNYTWSFTVVGSLVAPDADTVIRIARHPTETTLAEVFINNLTETADYCESLMSFQQWHVTGGSGNDELTVDYSQGSPMPDSGLTFDGGDAGGGNRLVIARLSGGEGVTVGASQVEITPATTINFSQATVSLGGTNTYTGGTTVLAGTLIVQSATALPPGRSLSIGSGGTLVIGGGTTLSTTAVTTSVAEAYQVAIAPSETEIFTTVASAALPETRRADAYDTVLGAMKPIEPAVDLSWLQTVERFRARSLGLKRDPSLYLVLAMESDS